MSNKNKLGFISAKFESSGKINTISEDTGNTWSYGKHQLNSGGALQDYMSKSKFREYFNIAISHGDKPGSNNFNVVWEYLCDTYPKEFEEDQDSYTLSLYFTPVREYATKLGYPETTAVNESIYSMAIQHGAGGARRMLKLTSALVTKEQLHSEKDILKELYNQRSIFVNGLTSLSTKVKEQLQNRYDKELKEILKLIGE